MVVGKQDRLSASNLISDSSVKQDDLTVGAGPFYCKEPFNIIAIFEELLLSVLKYKSNRSRSGSPGSRPFRASLNFPFRFSAANADLCLSNASLSLWINCNTVE